MRIKVTRFMAKQCTLPLYILLCGYFFAFTAIWSSSWSWYSLKSSSKFANNQEYIFKIFINNERTTKWHMNLNLTKIAPVFSRALFPEIVCQMFQKRSKTLLWCFSSWCLDFEIGRLKMLKDNIKMCSFHTLENKTRFLSLEWNIPISI